MSLVRDPFDVAAVVGQADAAFQAGAAAGFILVDEVQIAVVPVQGYGIVVILEVEVRDPDVPEDCPGHPVQTPPEGFLERRRRTDDLTVVGIVRPTGVRIQVIFHRNTANEAR
jgi:hypothetical protein